jgi:hypothetical protein
MEKDEQRINYTNYYRLKKELNYNRLIFDKDDDEPAFFYSWSMRKEKQNI